MTDVLGGIERLNQKFALLKEQQSSPDRQRLSYPIRWKKESLRLLEESGLTQKSFAELLGINHSLIVKWRAKYKDLKTRESNIPKLVPREAKVRKLTLDRPDLSVKDSKLRAIEDKITKLTKIRDLYNELNKLEAEV